MIRPSFHTGFAPRDGEARYPSLWRGCVGAWAPCLGPTGVTLRDWQNRYHGTLTNMSTDGDWVLSQGRHALDLDGTDDHVATTLPCATLLGTTSADLPVTFSAWVAFRSSSASPVIANKDNGSAGSDIFFFGKTAADKIALYLYDTSATDRQAVGSTASVTVDSTMRHYAVTYDGRGGATASAGMVMYVNGLQVATTSDNIGTYTAVSPSDNIAIGARWTAGTGTAYANALIDDIRIYDRVLAPWEIQLLAQRRGIAYELDDIVLDSERAAVAAIYSHLLTLGVG